jgi:hypothetical protein
MSGNVDKVGELKYYLDPGLLRSSMSGNVDEVDELK